MFYHYGQTDPDERPTAAELAEDAPAPVFATVERDAQGFILRERILRATDHIGRGTYEDRPF